MTRRGPREKWTVVLATCLALALPGVAHAAKVGGGTVSGTMVFGPGIPPAMLGQACAESTIPPFQLSAETFVLDTVITGYVGSLTIDIAGSTECETYSLGSSNDLVGTVNSVSQINGSQIQCPPAGSALPPLRGGFQRVFGHMRLRLAGPCEINEEEVTPVSFVGSLAFSPSTDDPTPTVIPGLTAPVTSAEVIGPFAVTPG